MQEYLRITGKIDRSELDELISEEIDAIRKTELSFEREKTKETGKELLERIMNLIDVK